ncbi:aminopeptidase [Amycolatopsis alba DSM 44262]|uniref:Aminopeptidase n=1 Tax=Amycolatopsis alba DSM 44262 TaxID=1125972 RepID=A0A229RG82_AMYAL|nr:M1 family aminopeptidase [Amycolatopsis alba]OXM45668.1 aminopeptidase [Amycolatopsis alba DSM 44262]
MGERASVLVVESYDIGLELDPVAEFFRSRTVVRFACEQKATFADLSAHSVEKVVLNGHVLTVAEVWDGARLTLSGLDTVSHVLEAEALFPYAAEGRGLRRSTDPDGTTYTYGMNFPHASPRVFCCFDDPGLRARVKLTLTAPQEWTRLVNGTAEPIAPYLVVGAAGPWASLCRTTIPSGVPLAVYARRYRAAGLDRGKDIADLMARSIAFYEHHLEVAYPYEKCEVVFVRDLPSLAFSAPGLILVNDKVFDFVATRGPRYAATVISHEVAHAWIGGLVDCGDDAWLVEACATYLSRTAIPELAAGSDPWATAESPDNAYAPDAELIRQLENTIGREGVLRGLRLFFDRFAHRNAGRAELAACWSETSGHDLSAWAADRTGE